MFDQIHTISWVIAAMKELRCIVFNEQEVANAILDRRRRRREPLPIGQIAGISVETARGLKVILHLLQDDGSMDQEEVGETDTMAAVIAFCMNRKIPLPVESDKFLFLVNESLALMITMNFNRPPRLVFGNGEGDGSSSRARRVLN